MFLNSIRNGAVIIAASGMCEAGRVRHHLRHNLARRECGHSVHRFPGGRHARPPDRRRRPRVRLFDASVPVHASVHTLGGLSAHAGQDSLMGWLPALAPAEDDLSRARRAGGVACAVARIARELRWSTTVAAPGTRYDV